MRIALLLLTLFAPVASAGPVTVHVVVALCDNDSQGIVPVPCGAAGLQPADLSTTRAG